MYEDSRAKRRPRGGVLITLRRRMRGDESGQALVEFAIVVPLIVTVFLFAQWGWELVQIRLKVQEAARFAAWEATAYPLHDYEKGKANGFSKMRTSVVAETMMRYGDLNSATTIPSGLTIWSATWTPPIVMITDGQEEMIYGGAIVNLIFNIISQVGALIAGLLYNSQNKVALSLITSAKSKSSGKGPGKAMASLFGPTEWGFNKKGYVTARVGTYVKNEWFNVRLLGKPIFNNPGFIIYESHGVLADSWRLNKKGDKAWKKGNDKSPGFSSGAMYKQVERMYLMTKTTRTVAKVWAASIYTTMFASAKTTGILSVGGPSLSDFTKPSVVMGSYQGGKPESGLIRLREDIGQRKYDSAPMRGAYLEALKQRGEYFMGCKEAEKLGCTDTLSQDNPFGDYIVRE
ncbi:MAG: hypothetical protein CSA65_09190 [Proteobacteria bacterium]|nr:MAG: hypothetical protein CSB49_08100 [Pseudomonadota bacterium]PIE17350.1 MAG: hypothetical protein CSA65_09190 [Pseudomonadota bacterium]